MHTYSTKAEETVAWVGELDRQPDIVIADCRLHGGPELNRTHSWRPRPVRPPIPGLVLHGETDLQFLHECASNDLGIDFIQPEEIYARSSISRTRITKD
jgi:hypothetical protein